MKTAIAAALLLLLPGAPPADASDGTRTVRFAPQNSSCYFNVFPPGADAAIHIGSSAGDAFTGGPGAGGTYKI